MVIGPPRQRNSAPEGMALGLVMSGCDEVPFVSRMRVDLAIERAWRDWPDAYRGQFSHVNTDLVPGTVAMWVMLHADKGSRRAPSTGFGNVPRYINYWRRSDWDADNSDGVASAVNGIHGSVPLAGWIELAATFLSALQDLPPSRSMAAVATRGISVCERRVMQ